MSAPDQPGKRSLGFLLLYALAHGGAAIGYVPLLTLLLPIKIEELAPAEKVAILSLATLTGAVAASAANILAGMFSDRSVGRPGGRRLWVATGLIATFASYGLIWISHTPLTVIASVIVFQLALNSMIAPLMAIAADEIPDSQKGLVGGLFGAVYPLGALAAILVTASHARTEGVQFLMIGVLMLVTIAPFLLLERQAAPLHQPAPSDAPTKALGRRNLTLVWFARLLVQVAGGILFAFFLFYFESVDHGGLPIPPRELAGKISWLSGVVAMISIPAGILIGRLSDASGARKPLLTGAVIVLTLGLLVMALLPSWAPAALGYVLFSCGVGVFLALQATYAMRLLPSATHRGRDLGILNLTNTIPALIVPTLAWPMITTVGFGPLLLILAVLTTLSGVLMMLVHEQA